MSYDVNGNNTSARLAQFFLSVHLIFDVSASMPGLVRKLLIFAAVDGLVLQPLTQKGQRPASSSKISFKDGSIVPSGKEDVPNEARTRGFEAFGIVGKLPELVITEIRRNTTHEHTASRCFCMNSQRK